MGPDLVVVTAPSLQLFGCVGKGEEPVGVQAFGPKSPVERFNEGVVSGLPGPGEVQDDAATVGPQIQVTGDELRALVDPDRLRKANLGADAI